MKKNNSTFIVAAISLGLIGAFLFIVWRMGVFDLEYATTNIDVTTPLLALFGAIIGAIVTLIGTFVKLSVDQRNSDLKEQAEKRLAQEAVIQAVQSLSTSSGADVPESQRAGVLFALVNLDQIPLAITMLGQMLSSGKIDGYSASCLIDHTLKSGDKESIHEALIHLIEYPKIFLREGGNVSFPECLLYKCNTSLSLGNRENAAVAIIEIIAARKMDEWDEGVLGHLILTLNMMWKDETDTDLKTGIGHCLYKILNKSRFEETIKSHHGEVDIIDLKKRLEEEGTEEIKCSYFFTSLSKLFDV